MKLFQTLALAIWLLFTGGVSAYAHSFPSLGTASFIQKHQSYLSSQGSHAEHEITKIRAGSGGHTRRSSQPIEIEDVYEEEDEKSSSKDLLVPRTSGLDNGLLSFDYDRSHLHTKSVEYASTKQYLFYKVFRL